MHSKLHLNSGGNGEPEIPPNSPDEMPQNEPNEVPSNYPPETEPNSLPESTPEHPLEIPEPNKSSSI